MSTVHAIVPAMNLPQSSTKLSEVWAVHGGVCQQCPQQTHWHSSITIVKATRRGTSATLETPTGTLQRSNPGNTNRDPPTGTLLELMQTALVANKRGGIPQLTRSLFFSCWQQAVKARKGRKLNVILHCEEWGLGVFGAYSRCPEVPVLLMLSTEVHWFLG